MIYVNGDGFAAASFANSKFSWSSQDENQSIRGFLIHPKNHEVSFGKTVSFLMHQPYRNDAYQFNSHLKIFRETYNIIEKENVSHVIIVWPTIFNGEVFVDNQYHQFTFRYIDDIECNKKIKDSMFDQMRLFNTNTAYDDFENKINDLCQTLNNKGIKHLMISNHQMLPKGNANWLWENNTVRNWAKIENFINEDKFLTVNGHKSLAKLILQNLTNQ